jgi:hypothetical protein
VSTKHGAKSAYDLKLEAMGHIDRAVAALIEAGEEKLGGKGAGYRLLDDTARRLSNMHNELRATCTQCGVRPTQDGSCTCSA